MLKVWSFNNDTNTIIVYFVVSKTGLNQACSAQDTCKDPNSVCVQGFCQCQKEYYEKGGFCGMSSLSYVKYICAIKH